MSFPSVFAGGKVAPGMDWVIEEKEGTPVQLWDGELVRIAKGTVSKWSNQGWEEANFSSLGILDVVVVMGVPKDGMYFFAGPGIKGNNHKFPGYHIFPFMDGNGTPWNPRNLEQLKLYFAQNPEKYGILYVHPDGRMAQVLRTDLGFEWEQNEKPKPPEPKPRPAKVMIE